MLDGQELIGPIGGVTWTGAPRTVPKAVARLLFRGGATSGGCVGSAVRLAAAGRTRRVRTDCGAAGAAAGGGGAAWSGRSAAAVGVGRSVQGLTLRMIL